MQFGSCPVLWRKHSPFERIDFGGRVCEAFRPELKQPGRQFEKLAHSARPRG